MPRRRVTPGVVQRLLLVCLVLAWVVGSTHGATGNAPDLLGPCEPSFVHQRSRPRVTPVASRLVGTTPEAAPGAVRPEWVGHSSFLLTSPMGVRILTDPHAFYSRREAPDAVTVSNLQVTHLRRVVESAKRRVHSLSGSPRVAEQARHVGG